MNRRQPGSHRGALRKIARRAMLERGLLPDFPPKALEELSAMERSAHAWQGPRRDLRHLLWCSIDNDDSKDLDQLTVSVEMPGGMLKILVAVADVDALVKGGTAIDGHARHNTTSVYTAAEVFPMLPEGLSAGLTSLNPGADRPAVVVEMTVAYDGSLAGSDIYPAAVRNHAKLAYNSLAAWLEGAGPVPEQVARIEGLGENLRAQEKTARWMKYFRHLHGALSLETVEASPVFEDDELKGLRAERRNPAKDIIEDFMIAANGVTARFLESRGFPSLRRVVDKPKRWDRIVEIAAEHGRRLPEEPEARALEQFLQKEKKADPERFPDLSLAIIKSMGPGEYIAEFPGGEAVGHFGLAVKDYTHSTAPNRRYPDLVTHRLLKAAMAGGRPPYGAEELKELAAHCTEKEDAARKVERQVGKSAAAMLFEGRIGEQFDAIVTGASAKGTWVRLPDPPVEGRLLYGFQGADVGHRVRVQLVHT
ncbi:MAG: RNB domain-containing ribonuclease, partial [Nitrospiraceae bacterium]|nr:RNB domain-containing ribonuclease [Nitrospiraceae bacterium]